MNLLRTTVHGVLDSLFALPLLTWPRFAGIYDNVRATGATMAAGAVTVSYSLLTNDLLGLFRTLPVAINLVLDVVVARNRIVSPYLLGIDDLVSWPHVFFGGALIAMVLISPLRVIYQTVPPRSGSLTEG